MLIGEGLNAQTEEHFYFKFKKSKYMVSFILLPTDKEILNFHFGDNDIFLTPCLVKENDGNANTIHGMYLSHNNEDIAILSFKDRNSIESVIEELKELRRKMITVENN